MGRIKYLLARDFGDSFKKKLIYGGVASVLLFGSPGKTGGREIDIQRDDSNRVSDYSRDCDERLSSSNRLNIYLGRDESQYILEEAA